MCFGSLHKSKPDPFISQILIIRPPHAVHFEAKSARLWNYSPEETRAHFPPGSTFYPSRNAVATWLDFVEILCTQLESKLPILMENNKSPEIILARGQIGFPSFGRLWQWWSKVSDTRPLWAAERNPLDKWTKQRLFLTTFNHSFPVVRWALANSLWYRKFSFWTTQLDRILYLSRRSNDLRICTVPIRKNSEIKESKQTSQFYEERSFPFLEFSIKTVYL